MKCALIQENKVYDIVDLTEEEIQAIAMKSQAVVDITDMSPQPQIGWDFGPNGFIIPIGVVSSKKITKLALRNRFNITEKVTIEAAAAQNDSNGFLLRSWLSDFNVSTYIDLSRPDTIAGVQFLEANGLIGTGRADEILNNEITEMEKYRG